MPGSNGASGFVQLIRRSKTGKRRNIPPGASSADSERVRDAVAGEVVGGLEPARAAADDDDVVPAGRMRTRVYLGQSSALRRRRASAWSMRYITRGRSSRNGSTSGAGTTRQRTSDAATTSAIGGEPSSTEISPKNSPRPKPRDLAVAEPDDHLALEDQVQAGAGQPFAQDPLALREDLLVRAVRDRLELGLREVGEEAEARERLDELGTSVRPRRQA